jgi:hypothetical protein
MKKTLYRVAYDVVGQVHYQAFPPDLGSGQYLIDVIEVEVPDEPTAEQLAVITEQRKAEIKAEKLQRLKAQIAELEGEV